MDDDEDEDEEGEVNDSETDKKLNKKRNSTTAYEKIAPAGKKQKLHSTPFSQKPKAFAALGKAFTGKSNSVLKSGKNNVNVAVTTTSTSKLRFVKISRLLYILIF